MIIVNININDAELIPQLFEQICFRAGHFLIKNETKLKMKQRTKQIIETLNNSFKIISIHTLKFYFIAVQFCDLKNIWSHLRSMEWGKKIWNLFNCLYVHKKSQLNATDVWACKKKYNNNFHMFRKKQTDGVVKRTWFRTDHRLSLAVVVIIINIFISHYPLNSLSHGSFTHGWEFVLMNIFGLTWRHDNRSWVRERKYHKIFIAMICQFYFR